MENSSTKYDITMCVCFDTTFEEMKKIMKEKNLSTIDELRQVKKVAMNCRLCEPYVKKMIETGQTRFEVILK